VIPVVVDASAGVELVVDTARGRALRGLLPIDAVPWAPDIFYVEVDTVLPRTSAPNSSLTTTGLLTPQRCRCVCCGSASSPKVASRLRDVG
jgi:hypothetical protein